MARQRRSTASAPTDVDESAPPNAEREDLVSVDDPSAPEVEPEPEPEPDQPPAPAPRPSPSSVAPLTPEYVAYLATPINRRPPLTLTTDVDALAAQIESGRRASGASLAELQRRYREASDRYTTESQRLLHEMNEAKAALTDHKHAVARARGAEQAIARHAPAALSLEYQAASRAVVQAERELSTARHDADRFALLVKQSNAAIGRLQDRISRRGPTQRMDRAPIAEKLRLAESIREKRADELAARNAIVEGCTQRLDAALAYAEEIKSRCVEAVLAAVHADPPRPAGDAA